MGVKTTDMDTEHTDDIPKDESEPKNVFPYDVISGCSGAFVDVYSKYMEAPPEFLYMAYLTALGAVFSRNVSLASALETQPRLFTILVGESATDRKSTVLSKIDNHFRRVVYGFNSCWGLGSAEGLQRLTKSEDKSLDGGPGMILIFDELKQFVNKCGIKNSVMLPAINTLFESNRYENHIRDRSVLIDDAYVSLLAASTLPTYEKIYDNHFLDIGWPNRCFLVVGTAERRFSVPEEIPEEKLSALRQDLIALLKHVGTGLKLGLTQEARDRYHDWYMSMPESVHAKRLDTISLRLTMLLAVNDYKSEINLEIIEKAISLCDWQLRVREEYDVIDADNLIATMEEKIRRVLKQNGHLTERNIKRKTNAHRAGLWAYNQARDNLRGAGEIIYDRGKGYRYVAQ